MLVTSSHEVQKNGIGPDDRNLQIRDSMTCVVYPVGFYEILYTQLFLERI